LFANVNLAAATLAEVQPDFVTAANQAKESLAGIDFGFANQVSAAFENTPLVVTVDTTNLETSSTKLQGVVTSLGRTFSEGISNNLDIGLNVSTSGLSQNQSNFVNVSDLGEAEKRILANVKTYFDTLARDLEVPSPILAT